MQLTAKLNDDKMKAQKAEIDDLNQALLDRERMLKEFQQELDNSLAGRDEELNGLRLKIKDWSESLLVKDEIIGKQRQQAQELKNNILALEVSKESLKRTVQETQNELCNLVQVHEKLTVASSSKQ